MNTKNNQINQLAKYYLENKQFDYAENLFKEVLKTNSSDFETNELIGNLYYEIGNYELAISHLRFVFDNEKLQFQSTYNLGSALLQTGNINEAINIFEFLNSTFGNSFEVTHDLATCYAMNGRFDLALENFHECLNYDVQSFQLHYNIGRAYDEYRNYKSAIEHYEKAIQLNPKFELAYVNKATDLALLKRYDESIACLKKALNLNPKIDWILGDLIHLARNICDWNANIFQIKEFQKLIMDGNKVTSPGVLLSIFDRLDLQFKAAKIYSDVLFPTNKCLGEIKQSQSEKIRIGYFSADFHNHPTAYLLAEIFELHNKDKFEIFAFSFGPITNDHMRQRLTSSFDEFLEVSNKTDLEIAKLSRYFHIDIAVNLNGFTQNARPGIFSYRAAPIQVNYLAYPGTMGVNYMDYLIADKNLIPINSEKYYKEKIIYLPNCYQPNDRLKKVSNKSYSKSELGLPAQGFIYCCFNNNFKITPEIFSAWMKILKSVEWSVIWLFKDNQWAAENLRNEAQKNGVSKDRLVFAERIEHSEHLARYHLADLFLDTFPYGAHTTASESLWVGLPVLTMRGETFASRVAASLLKNMNFPDLIAESREEYINLAIEIGNSPEKLASLKNRLKSNRASTPLFNSPLYAKNIERAYEIILENYKMGNAIDHVFVS